MAITNIVPIHKGDTSIQTYLKKKIDYITDKNKTENQTLVNSYMCDPDMADLQFSISKESYFRNTGRTQERDVIAYRLLQSFHAHEVIHSPPR
ncbi:MAG: hypothetical protein R3Y53_05135 [Bacillota bacterium]